MAVTSKQIHTPRGATVRAAPTTRSFTPVSAGLTLLLAIAAVYLLVNGVVGWAGTRLDDLRYGVPRTTQLDGIVGHEGASGQPTHFVAMNLNGQVVVLELVGGDPNTVRSLPGPYLFGADGPTTPVRLALRDMDGDGKPDLIVDVRSEQIVYLNKDGSFRLPSADEQRKLVGA